MTIQERLTAEFNIKPWQTENVIALIDEGNTIPFISRYRKEATGELNDEVLRSFDDRLKYLRALEERREDIKRLIDEQGFLTEELTEAIDKAEMLTELEDIYRPYRPKRRTRATIAKEKGLEPLARFIRENSEESKIEAEAEKYIDEEKEIMSTEDALNGAMDIIAEEISDNADYRKAIRRLIFKHGILKSKATTEEDSVYAQYYDYSEPVLRIAPHRVLAIDRGENEKFLSVGIELDTEIILEYLNKKEEKRNNGVVNKWNIMSTEDAYKRLIAPSIEREIRNDLTENAQEKAMVVFKVNLKNLLMQPPIKGMRVIGLDPGYRTGCKVGVVDEYGKVLDTGVIYVTHSQAQKDSAKELIKKLIKKHDIKLISIGNGTASGETEVFVSETIKEIPEAGTKYIITNEAGASVYSASKLG
ncbi:MAG: RNA-binding transcriptional accessory protein, partial [Clostridia bacterium]|nr:RNA-binding transcriptional accessory protein [Clostridia bacterium]